MNQTESNWHQFCLSNSEVVIEFFWLFQSVVLNYNRKGQTIIVKNQEEPNSSTVIALITLDPMTINDLEKERETA